MRRAPLHRLLPLLLVAGCVARPELGERTTATTGARGVLATDFARAEFSRRTQSLGARLTGLVADELSPPRTLSWDRLVTAPDRRLQNLGETTGRLADLAARSRFDHAGELGREFSPDAVTREFAEDLASLPLVLGLDRPVLPEIDDRRHRTDPWDDREEADWFERLRRRLRL